MPKRVALMFLVLTACESQREAPVTRSVDLSSHAVTIIRPTPGGPALTEVRQVIEIGDRGNVAVVDASEPFLRLYSRDGHPLAAGGREGTGPNEFRRPFLLATDGGTAWITDFRDLVEWNLDAFRERRRTRVPPNVVALLRGCGDRLVTVAQVKRRPTDEDRLDSYGLYSLSGEEWRPIAPFVPLATPLTLGGPDARAAAFGNGIAFFNFFRGQLELHACDGGDAEVVNVPRPEHWLRTQPYGLAAVRDEIVVFFAGGRGGEQADTTRVAVWNPATGAVRQRILLGDYRLHAASEGLMWIVENTLDPRILGIPPADVFELLGLAPDG